MLELIWGVQYTNTLYQEISSEIDTTCNMVALDNSIHAMWDKGALFLTPLGTNGPVLRLVRYILPATIYMWAMHILYQCQNWFKARRSSCRLHFAHLKRDLTSMLPGDRDSVTYEQHIWLSVSWLCGYARMWGVHRSSGYYATTPPVMNRDFFPLETLNTPPSLYRLTLFSLFPNLLSTASYIPAHLPPFLQPHATSFSLLPLTSHPSSSYALAKVAHSALSGSWFFSVKTPKAPPCREAYCSPTRLQPLPQVRNVYVSLQKGRMLTLSVTLCSLPMSGRLLSLPHDYDLLSQSGTLIFLLQTS